MDFSPPPSSDSDPNLLEFPNMSSDLGLDPADPLNLLLHNTSQGSSDSSMEDTDSNPPDWSQFSHLWSHMDGLNEPVKFPDLNMDFSLPLDMDFNPNMSVDPNSLHFNYPETFSTLNDYSYAPASSFTFQLDPTQNSFPPQRRLSVTSSSSSSGASLSPVLSQAAAASTDGASSPSPPPHPSPADELAQRVRQSAGVMLAVPAGTHASAYAPNPPSKLPIPRLPQPKPLPKRAPKSGSSSTASTPPPSDDASSSSFVTSQPYFEATGLQSTSIAPAPARPKTSHTTIERRYRTNLNARIQSLRLAVPALRVLEEKKAKKGGSDENESGGAKADGDVIDERGFVDGVKVARKCSKANVLGKAVEYIRVLKNREQRLMREQDGLKSLVCGLVGGPALLREWETEWKMRFGGPERDEVEPGDAELGDGEEGDDSEGDDEDDEDEGKEGRRKKKARVMVTAVGTKKKKDATVTKEKKEDAKKDEVSLEGGMVVPEKRKRGRPRKVVPAPTSASALASSPPPITAFVNQAMKAEIVVPPMPTETQATEPPPTPAHQYLLATFALFSFFNSPLTTPSPSSSSSPSATHTGVVLSQSYSHLPQTQDTFTYGWRDLVQVFHLVVSALVLLSILLPWLPKSARVRIPIPSLSSLRSVMNRKSSRDGPSATQIPRKPRGAALVDALSLSASDKQTREEAVAHLRAALGVGNGVLGLLHAVLAGKGKGGRGNKAGFEQWGLEQRAWVRLGEIGALDSTTPLTTRLFTYMCISTRISWFAASPCDLCTLALLIRPLAPGRAEKLWERARGRTGLGQAPVVRAYERLVLECIGVDTAADMLKALEHSRLAQPQGREKRTPIGVLAEVVVRERVREHAKVLFVRAVLGVEEDVEAEEAERRKTGDAARSLGGPVAALGDMLDRVRAGNVVTEDEAGSGGETGVDGEIWALLSALAMYRRLFPSSIHGDGQSGVAILLTPPQSPSKGDAGLCLRLRQTLDSAVFEGVEEDGEGKCGVLKGQLEDARDRVVDMLTAARRERSWKTRGKV